MFLDTLPLLQCPLCHSHLHLDGRASADESELVAGSVVCDAGHAWPIEEGVTAFTREDAPSDPWSKSFKDYDRFAANNRKWISSASGDVGPIVDSLPVDPPSPYLDLCTGGGALLFHLLEKVGHGSRVVSVDMSLHAQRYNRRLFGETCGGHGVSFLSGDAADLPVKDGVFSCVSAFGLGNMLEKTPLGIAEATRVLQKGGAFIFEHIYVQEQSQRWRALQDSLEKRGVEYRNGLLLERNFVALMESIGFVGYEIQVIEEVMGDPGKDVTGGPLFPYPNEPMEKLLVKAWK